VYRYLYLYCISKKSHLTKEMKETIPANTLPSMTIPARVHTAPSMPGCPPQPPLAWKTGPTPPSTACAPPSRTSEVDARIMITDARVLVTGARILVTRVVQGHTGLLCVGGGRPMRRAKVAVNLGGRHGRHRLTWTSARRWL
jgi:hypothetical protein